MRTAIRNPRILLLAAAVLLSLVPTGVAHIVPPEDLHPVAEAHRRLGFVLNLNPILWDVVKADIATVEAGLSEMSGPDAGKYRASVDAFLIALETEAQISSPTPTMRKRTARGIYERSTVAVARTIELHLASAESMLGDFDGSVNHFDTARQIWAAFEHELRAADPNAYVTLGLHWLAGSEALGSPPVLGVGGLAPDAEVFHSETRAIRQYLSEHFGEDFVVADGARLSLFGGDSGVGYDTGVAAAKLPPGSNTNKQLPRPRQILHMASRGVDESETVLIALGDMAFDSPYIFGSPSRELAISCNSCHNKGVTNPNFFVPGLSARPGSVDVSNAYLAPHANNGVFDALDIPDLRGIRYTAPYGRNGRFGSLRDFVRNGIMHEFNGSEPDPVIVDAIVAYMNEFDFLPNPKLGPNGTLTEAASDAARRGEALFKRPFAQMNDMSCASCHEPSNHFLDGKRHDIGSMAGSGLYAMDGALDTPTLLSAKFTPPYFHDGSLATLRDVVVWFDARYGLGLSGAEIDDLTAYVETVGDGVDAYEDTVYTLEAELEEFRFFLSSYDYVRRMEKPELLNVLFQTIATEIRAHKWDVQDDSHLPTLDKMAQLMDDAYMANQVGNADKVDALVREYRALYAANAAVLK